MSLSFTLRENADVPSPRGRRKVLVTGAGGQIGSYFAEHARDAYDLRLQVHHPDEHGRIADFGEIVQAEINDLPAMRELCEGIDTVVHLAATPSPSATWETLRDVNISGTYNLMVAAKAAGCRRVIYASSIHAVSGYPTGVQVKTSEAVNPGDLYGVSKCFGEALGRYMAEREGLSVIALRIGAFQPRDVARDEKSLWMLDAYVSRRDLHQLIIRSIEVDNLQFAIFHGLSNNRFNRLDINDARELLGYTPVDDSTELNPDLHPLDLRANVFAHNQEDPGSKPGIREELQG